MVLEGTMISNCHCWAHYIASGRSGAALMLTSYVPWLKPLFDAYG